MADSPVPRPLVARLDRSSLERVLARAAELQGTSDSGDASDQFTEEQLLELGKEVGLSPQHLRQALAEEKTRSIVPDNTESGIAAGIFGPSRVNAARTVPGKPADVLATIDTWMQNDELLIVKRQFGNRIVWERRQDFLVGVKRALKTGGRDYALSNAYEVSVTVVEVDAGRVHVVLDADVRNQRSQATGQVVASGSFGAVATASMLFMGVMTAVAVAPVVVLTAAGFAGARAYQRRILTRAQLALDQLLDRLERGEFTKRPRESLLDAIVAAALPSRRF